MALGKHSPHPDPEERDECEAEPCPEETYQGNPREILLKKESEDSEETDESEERQN
jgi:hypothetical protein